MKKLYILLAAVVTFAVALSSGFACKMLAYEPKKR